MNGSARWPSGFGNIMDEVRSVMVHLTAGWPARQRVEEFVTRYIGPPVNADNRRRAGIGPQYFIAGDGTVFPLIHKHRVTWHGNNPFNNWAIGVETGNLGDDAPPQFPIPADPDDDDRWRAMGPDPHLNASDIPGIKLWYQRRDFREVVVSWWTTNTYGGPAREPVGNTHQMLFTEWQYRSWALLARFLCEQHELPRNFPLLPHALRTGTISNSGVFRRIVLADERFPVLVRALSRYNILEEHFEAANAATLQARYADEAAIQRRDENKLIARHSLIWRDMFNVYRGFHGHGYSGSRVLARIKDPEHPGQFKIVETDHDCPGPLFDWHRFAREVWDWWWYPFDLTDDLSTAVTTRRQEYRANGDTPLVEYYFESRDFAAKDLAYTFRTIGAGSRDNGIFGRTSSPSTFELEPGVPIYAPANGELVAARFPNTGDRVSMAFALVRHEVFHLPNTLTIEIDGLGSVPAHPGRIDYDREPSYVYSLVMHVGRPEGMSFEEVTPENPEWLNRVLIRKKECDLGIALFDRPDHGGVNLTAWNSRPPGSVQRPTVLEGWRADQIHLRFFLDRLRGGDVATNLAWLPNVTPIRIILGDYLGQSGVIRKEGNIVLHGIKLEVFAPAFFPPLPAFRPFTSLSGWDLPAGTPTKDTAPAILYESEWAKTPTAAERQRLEGIGVNPDLVPWWIEAISGTLLNPLLPAQARLPLHGSVFHFEPLRFMHWINDVTWASEWPKYQVTDEHGAEAPRPTRPRSRRV